MSPRNIAGIRLVEFFRPANQADAPPFPYENSDALVFHLNNADLGAYLEAVSPMLDEFVVELYGAVSEEAVEALRATGTPTTHYPNVLGYIRDLTP